MWELWWLYAVPRTFCWLLIVGVNDKSRTGSHVFTALHSVLGRLRDFSHGGGLVNLGSQERDWERFGDFMNICISPSVRRPLLEWWEWSEKRLKSYLRTFFCMKTFSDRPVLQWDPDGGIAFIHDIQSAVRIIKPPTTPARTVHRL